MMKKGVLIIICVLILQRICAQCDLAFEDKRVVSVCIVDYSLKIDDDSCLLQYNNYQILSGGNSYDSNSYVYKELTKEIQFLLDDIGHNKVPSAEDLDIDAVILKERFNSDLVQKKYAEIFLEPDSNDCMYILEKYQSLGMFTSWLQNAYPIIDSGVFVMNTAHDPRGIKIVVQTDRRTYYFDMRDIEMFQPYLMRTSDKNCLRFITNYNVNKHLQSLFKAMNIHREVPWRDEVIESYILFCAEEYRR